MEFRHVARCHEPGPPASNSIAYVLQLIAYQPTRNGSSPSVRNCGLARIEYFDAECK